MVNLHFLSLMEALMECRSTILAKLMPLWCPVLHAYNITVSSGLTHKFSIPTHNFPQIYNSLNVRNDKLKLH